MRPREQHRPSETDGPRLREGWPATMTGDGQTKGVQSGSQGVLLGHSVKRAEVNWHSEGAYHSPGDGRDEVEEMKVGGI